MYQEKLSYFEYVRERILSMRNYNVSEFELETLFTNYIESERFLEEYNKKYNR